MCTVLVLKECRNETYEYDIGDNDNVFPIINLNILSFGNIMRTIQPRRTDQLYNCKKFFYTAVLVSTLKTAV